ncbi:MAG: hypothetical protein RIR33_3660 [Pseudomonadota bacterium]|jgi:hypothetical protein
MTRAPRPARTGTARPSAGKARGRPLSYMSQRYASARPVAGKELCLNTVWMFAMELTPDLGAARGQANGRRYHRAGQHRLPTASTDAFLGELPPFQHGRSDRQIPSDPASRSDARRARSRGRKPPFVVKAWVGTTILQRVRWAYAAWCESAVTESRRPIAFNTPSRVVSLGFPSALSDL